MQPGSSNTGPVHADFVKPGVIYGFRTVGDYGDYSDGLGNVYYFGRSKQKCFLDLPVSGEDMIAAQKEMLKKKGRFTGLSGPSTMLLWVRVTDIEKFWDDFRMRLRDWLPHRVQIENVSPLITQQCVLGDQYYTVENMNVGDFGKWCRETMEKLIVPPRVFRIDVEV